MAGRVEHAASVACTSAREDARTRSRTSQNRHPDGQCRGISHLGAAVHGYRGPARGSGVRRDEEADDPRDLLRLDPPRVVRLRHRCAVRGRVDHAREDRVGPHPGVAVLGGQRTDQARGPPPSRPRRPRRRRAARARSAPTLLRTPRRPRPRARASRPVRAERAGARSGRPSCRARPARLPHLVAAGVAADEVHHRSELRSGGGHRRVERPPRRSGPPPRATAASAPKVGLQAIALVLHDPRGHDLVAGVQELAPTARPSAPVPPVTSTPGRSSGGLMSRDLIVDGPYRRHPVPR